MHKKILVFFFLILSVTGRGDVMALELRSTAFKNGDFIPNKYTCKGENVSPALEWDRVPSDTKSFALVSDDPDAPSGSWIHWVIYNIPADKKNLPEAVKKENVLPDGSKQGLNDFRTIGYGGPCPPPGSTHRYFFKLYALNTMLNLKPGLTKDELLKAIKGWIVEEAQLMGRFKR